ncbi:MAG: hypothetical protein J6V44_12100 [Methanobrevibacter sp.]|nr:hypothetical protein [Methanobrevibacter sp.]
MTARELYEYALIEVNKIEAPSLLLEDYNYFINKAVQQYINKVYNRYDVNQQSTDDLKVLKTSAAVELEKHEQWQDTALLGKAYIAELPNDYLHILNCIVEYLPKVDFKCYETNVPVHFAARRLTADMYAGILNNAYMRPMYKRPYYYINNVNTVENHATNPSMDEIITNSDRIDSVRAEYDRVSNTTKVLLEIRYGKDDTLFIPQKVYVDYIKSPMFIRLTQSQLDMDIDTSQVLEFPDYVCFEIVNEFVKLLMENASDPRLQSNLAINQTIAGAPQEQPQQRK